MASPPFARSGPEKGGLSPASQVLWLNLPRRIEIWPAALGLGACRPTDPKRWIGENDKMTEVNNMGWFVAQLRPNGLALARRHLERQNFETFSPEIPSRERRQGRLQTVNKPLFPGYLFVRFDPRTNGWTAINHTRGVSRLVLNDPRRPAPLPEALMAALRARCESNGDGSAGDDLVVGDRVRIQAGPFEELITQIETLPGPERVGVLIEIMGREVRSTLPRSQVSKID